MKKKRVLIVTLLILVGVLALTGCTFSENNGGTAGENAAPTTVTVNYYVNDNIVKTVPYDSILNISIPSELNKYTWYLDKDFKNVFNKNNITGNTISLYGKLIEEKKTYNVELYLIDKGKEITVTTLTVDEKEIITDKIAAIDSVENHSEYKLLGTSDYNNTPITQNTKIKLNWEYSDFTINYYLGTSLYKSVDLEYNSAIITEKIKSEGYKEFIGWFDSLGNQVKDGMLMGDKNLNLYAKFKTNINAKIVSQNNYQIIVGQKDTLSIEFYNQKFEVVNVPKDSYKVTWYDVSNDKVEAFKGNVYTAQFDKVASYSFAVTIEFVDEINKGLILPQDGEDIFETIVVKSETIDDVEIVWDKNKDNYTYNEGAKLSPLFQLKNKYNDQIIDISRYSVEAGLNNSVTTGIIYNINLNDNATVKEFKHEVYPKDISTMNLVFDVTCDNTYTGEVLYKGFSVLYNEVDKKNIGQITAYKYVDTEFIEISTNEVVDNGKYKFVFTATDTNYTGNIEKEIIVDKADLTITAKNQTGTFNNGLADFKENMLDIVGLSDKDEITVTSTLETKDTVLNVGEHKIVVTVEKGNDNYNITLVDGIFTVDAKALELSDFAEVVDLNGYIYNGAAQTLNEAQTVDGNTVKFTYDKLDTFLDAGTYLVEAQSNGKNYTGSVVVGELVVGKKTIEKVDTTKIEKVYSREKISIPNTAFYNVSYLNNQNEETEIIDVGTYSIKYSLTNNYQWGVGQEEDLLQQVVVSKKQVTANWDNLTLSYTSEILAPTATLTGVIEGDIVNAKVTANGVDVGTHFATIELEGLSKNNYELSNPENKQYEIIKAEVKAIDVSGLEDQIYTSEAIQMPIIVKVKGVQLEAKDYVATFSNNVKVGQAKVTIELQNNFMGKFEETFKITQKPITVEWSKEPIVFNNTVQKPTATLNDVPVKDDVTVIVQADGKDAKEGYVATAILQGLDAANYTLVGSTTKYNILPLKVEKPLVSGIEDKTYNGQAHTQNITVKVNSIELVENTDYKVSYSNNTNATNLEKAKLIITFINNYEGTFSQEFNIHQFNASAAKVTINTENDLHYTGLEIKPTINVSLDNFTLTANDYDVKYIDNINVNSNSKVNVKFKGNFVGEVETNFEIIPLDGTDAVFGNIPKQEFTNTEKQPKPVIKLNNVTLLEGKDYKLTYEDNINASNAAKVIATFTGNYSGTKSTTFTISQKTVNLLISGKGGRHIFHIDSTFDQIVSELQVAPEECGLDTSIQFASTTYKFKQVSKDLENNKLTISLDITNVDGNFIFVATSFVATLVDTNAKITVGSKDIIDGVVNLKVNEDTTLKVINTFTDEVIPLEVIVEGGNLPIEAGSHQVTVSITSDEYHISKSNSLTFTLNIRHELTATIAKKEINYGTNTNTIVINEVPTTLANGQEVAGTWSALEDSIPKVSETPYKFDVTFTPNDLEIYLPYSTTVEVQVNKLNITNTSTNQAIANVEYNNSAISPVPTLQLNGKTLVEGQDYIINSIVNNTNAGTGTVKIDFIGNYSGTKDIKFTITQKPIEVKWSNLSFTYNGLIQKPTAELVGVYTNDLVTVEVEANGKDAATKHIATAKLAGTDATNYVIKEGTATKEYTINPLHVESANIVGVEDKPYNGLAQTQTITVDSYILDKDYTIEYLDNIDAGIATLIVKFKGNYGGQLSKNFNITKKDLTVLWSNLSLEYNNDIQVPTGTLKGIVTNDDVTVKITGSGKDVNLEGYIASAVLQGVDAKNYSITKDTITKTYYITAKPINEANVSNIVNKTYNGLAQEQQLTINDGSITLKNGIDYDLEYQNNTNVGQATIIITFKGNYSGSLTKYFTIDKMDASAATITLDSHSDLHYTGSAITPKVIVELKGYTITSADYDVTYSNNINVIGNSLVIVTFKGNYTGVVKKQFKIIPKVVTSATIQDVEAYTFDNTEKEPKLNIVLGKTLVENEDYTLSYQNNTNAGDLSAKVLVAFIGNYSGNLTKAFTIKPSKLSIATQKVEYSGRKVKTWDAALNEVKKINVEAFGIKVAGVFSYADADIPFGNATRTIKFDSQNSNFIGCTFTANFVAIKDIVGIDNFTVTPLVYNRQAQTPKLEFKFDGAVFPASNYSVKYPTSTNAGKYEAIVTFTEESGFMSSARDLIVKVPYEIKPYVLTVDKMQNSTLINGVKYLIIEHDLQRIEDKLQKISLDNTGILFNGTQETKTFNLDIGNVDFSEVIESFTFRDQKGKTINFAYNNKYYDSAYGGTFEILIDQLTSNYIFAENETNIPIIFKIKTISDLSKQTFYTIEDAITQLNNNGNTLYLYANTEFADENVKIYNTNSFNINQGTLVLPYYVVYTTKEGETSIVHKELRLTDKVLDEDVLLTGINGGKINKYSVVMTMKPKTKINLSGTSKIFVGGQPDGNGNCRTINTPAKLVMEKGSNITVSGGILDCMGFVTGEGTINANSGRVIDVMNLGDMANGGGMKYGVWRENSKLPFSQFNINNIEVELTAKAQASVEAHWKLKAANIVQGSELVLFSSNPEALFQAKSQDTYFVKTFDNWRMKFDVYGNINLNAIKMQIKPVSALPSINIDSAKTECPIPGNLTAEIHSGIFTLNKSIKLMPGAKIIIDEGAEMQVQNGGNIYLYQPSRAGTKFVLPNYYTSKDGSKSQTYVKYYPIHKTECYYRPDYVGVEDYTIDTDSYITNRGTVTVEKGGFIGGIINIEQNGIVKIKAGARVQGNMTDISETYYYKTDIVPLPVFSGKNRTISFTTAINKNGNNAALPSGKETENIYTSAS